MPHQKYSCQLILILASTAIIQMLKTYGANTEHFQKRYKNMNAINIILWFMDLF